MDLRDQLQQTLGTAYVIERELGGGGMSRVFLATETAFSRRVVIKVLPEEMSGHLSAERFKREIAIAARLQHSHIVPLLTAGEVDGLPYFTMPYVEGESLRTRVAQHGELPLVEAIHTLREIASALAHAHAHGVVHRDIKPENVLVSGGAAMVTDFGVAKAVSASTEGGASRITSLGVALGTPAYMSPEQAMADPVVDHRADIYSWGVVAYELLSGQSPFAGRPLQAVLAAHATEVPEPLGRRRPSVPHALADLVMRCLEKRAADRPQSADELVRALDALSTPGGGSPPASLKRYASLPSRRAMAAFVIGLAILAASWPFWQGRSAGTKTIRALAVLPLHDESGDTAQAYFAEGLTDEITDALGRLPGLTVASRTAARRFKGGLIDAKTIGRELGVGAFLQGTVRREGGRVRLNTQLVRSSDGVELWSDHFEHDARELYTVRSEMARRVADGLRLKLSDSTAATLATVSTRNSEAYDLYLKGRFLWNQRTKASIAEARALFSEAVKRDPRFALAWVGLADAEVVNSQYAEVSRIEGDAKALVALRNALAIDSTIAEAHATMGIVALNSYRWDEAEKEFQRAIALRPDYATAHHWRAMLLLSLGKLDESLAEITAAKRLDPLSRVIATRYATTAYHRKDFARTARELEDVLKLDPNFAEAQRWVGRTKMFLGDFVGAESTFRRAAELSGLGEEKDIGDLYARSGRRAEAQRIIDKLVAESKTRYVPPASVAIIYVAMGDNDRAWPWLERATDVHDSGVSFILVDPRLDPIRSDPRYPALLRRMNLLGAIAR